MGGEPGSALRKATIEKRMAAMNGNNTISTLCPSSSAITIVSTMAVSNHRMTIEKTTTTFVTGER